jgi:hypothetical protein
MSAVISDCGLYRYRLDRSWPEPMIAGKPGYVAWVMLNPSTADDVLDDKTIRRCMGFTKAWGYSALSVVNLFALRSRNPKALVLARDPLGPDNDRHLTEVVHGAEMVVCAWGGSYPRALRTYVDETAAGIVLVARRVVTLGRTGGGNPCHPLYVKGTTELVPW